MRYLDFATVKFGRGAHVEPTGAPTGDRDMCILEAVSYVAHEPWGDRPSCVCPVMSDILLRLNDVLDDADRDLLLPATEWIPLLLESKSTEAVSRRRYMMAVDWLVHTALPIWARDSSSPEFNAYIAALQELPPIDGSAQSLQLLIEKVDQLGRVRKMSHSIYPTGQVFSSGLSAIIMTVFFSSQFEGMSYSSAFQIANVCINLSTGTKEASPTTVSDTQRSVVDLLKRMRAVTADDLGAGATL